MSNPLALFRKHQKILLAVFGVALMIVFTVGGIVSQYMGGPAGASENSVVVRLDSGDLRESDLQNLRTSRMYVQSFMQNVDMLAAQRRATPRQRLRVPNRNDEQHLLYTYLLSRKAAQMGIQVTDDSIKAYLESYADGKIREGEFAVLLRQIGQGRMRQDQFFNAMRSELMALRFTELFGRGLAPLPPAVSWDYYQRLYRAVSLEAVPFEVTAYTSRVAEPSETAIAELYEDGKDRYPSPNSPEAGFKRRKEVALEYVKADLQTFLDEEKLKITDEQVQAYYEANKQEYRNVGLPPSETGAAAADGATDSPPANTSDEAGAMLPSLDGPTTIFDQDAGEGSLLPEGVGDRDAAPLGAESPPSTVDELPTVDKLPMIDELPELDSPPATDEPVGDDPAAEGQEGEEPAAEETPTEEVKPERPATEEVAPEEPATEEPETEEPQPEETNSDQPAAEESGSDEPVTQEPQAEEAPEQQPPTTESAADGQPKLLQDDPNDSEPKINEAPELDEAGEAADAEETSETEGTGEAETTDEEAAGESPDDSETAAAEAEPAEEMTEAAAPEVETEAATAGEETAASDDASTPPPNDEVDLGPLPEAPGNNVGSAQEEFRPLEEVTDEIRTRLARPKARERMDTAINSIRSSMASYYGDYIAWYVSEQRDKQPQPDPPDLRTLAQPLGLTAGEIPLVNEVELQETDPETGEPLYEISRAYDINYRRFDQIALDSDLPLYQEGSIRGAVLDTEFLFWKTKEVAERTPTLEECREDVVQALKLREALKLAQAEAREEMERVRQSGRSLGETYGNDPNRQVIETGSFTWMTPASVPYLPPQITRVPGIPRPGPDFMRDVFKLSEGEIGVATDNARRTVYLVRLMSEDSDPEKLKTDFFRSGVSMEIVQLSQQEKGEMLAEWYQQYQKQMGVKWERDPLPNAPMR